MLRVTVVEEEEEDVGGLRVVCPEHTFSKVSTLVYYYFPSKLLLTDEKLPDTF